MSPLPEGRRFRVALTADFYDAGGSPRYRDLGLGVLEVEPHIELRRFAEHRQEIGADQVEDAHGVIVLTPRVTAGSVSRAQDLLAIGRFGVGVDTVDVRACTAADVLVFIAAGAVDHSVAEAALAWMLALAYRVRAKDTLVRAGRWDERSAFMGSELRDRTLGVIGLGGIGRALIKLTAGFGMRRPLASDPHVDPGLASELGATLVSLDELLPAADFVSIHCPLNDETRNMIGRRELGLMKPEAYLINTARGGIVDEEALHEALAGRRIAGAAVDVFDREPLTGPHRFADLENVLLAPHSIAWTHELFRDIGRTVSRGMLDLSRGERPRGAVNPEVFEREGFRQKQARLTGG